MTKVVLTGGTGFIGANLARRLLADGHEVHLLVRPEFTAWRLRGIETSVSLHRLDLTREDEVAATLLRIRPEWVFHLAAHGGNAFQNNTVEIIRANTLATAILAEACVKAGVEIMIHTGSSSEYGLKDHAPAETEPVEPNSVYAHSKAAATELCRFFGRTHGVPMPTVRLYSIYGPFEDARRLPPTLVLHAREKRWPPLVAPETSRDFVFIDDAIDALIALAKNPPRDPSAVYNLGSGQQTSIRQLVELAREIFAVEAAPVWNTMPPRAWDTNVWVANPAKIKAELGWSPRIDLRRGLARLAEWLEADSERLKFYQQQAFSHAGGRS